MKLASILLSLCLVFLVIAACNDTPVPTSSTSDTRTTQNDEIILKGKLSFSDGTVFETKESRRIQIPEKYLTRSTLAKSGGSTITVFYISSNFTLDGYPKVTKNNVSAAGAFPDLIRYKNSGKARVATDVTAAIKLEDTLTEGSCSSYGVVDQGSFFWPAGKVFTAIGPGCLSCNPDNKLDQLKGELTTNTAVDFSWWKVEIQKIVEEPGFCE